MRTIRLFPLPALPPVETVTYSSETDYSLVVGPDAGVPPGGKRISWGDLTLSFSSDEQVFVAVDAYTNPANWERRALTMPHVDRTCAAATDCEFDQHGIASIPGDSPCLKFCAESRILTVELDGGPLLSTIQCLSGLVVGLGEGGALLRMWIALDRDRP